MTVRTRFAPSPTGFMHLGNLRTALYAYLYARHEKGTFVLRIEDTDQEREVEGAVEAIYRSLKQAGLSHDEGPDIGGEYGPYVQSQRKDTYLPYARQLVENGGAYYCFCTKERLEEARAEAEAKGETFKYDKHCMHLSKEEVEARLAAGEPYVIRQNVPTEGKASFDDVIYGHVEVDCSTLDDQVLIKADGLPTYNFANVIDDHLMGITHVLRGNEYLSSAPKYNLLYEALGWTPPTYVHLTPIMADSTRKLSKRRGDPTFEDLLNKGYLNEAIINYIVLLGWSPKGEREFFSLADLEQEFTLDSLNKSPAIFDTLKLNWFNAEYIRRMSEEEFYNVAKPWLTQVLCECKFDLPRVAQLLQARTEYLSQIPEMVDFLAEMPAFENDLYFHKKMKCDAEVAKKALTMLLPVLENMTEWTETAIHDTVMAAIAESGMKNGQALWPLRVAISGKASTPGGAIEIAYLLGKEETLRRLGESMGKL